MFKLNKNTEILQETILDAEQYHGNSYDYGFLKLHDGEPGLKVSMWFNNFGIWVKDLASKYIFERHPPPFGYSLF